MTAGYAQQPHSAVWVTAELAGCHRAQSSQQEMWPSASGSTGNCSPSQSFHSYTDATEEGEAGICWGVSSSQIRNSLQGVH